MRVNTHSVILLLYLVNSQIMTEVFSSFIVIVDGDGRLNINLVITATNMHSRHFVLVILRVFLAQPQQTLGCSGACLISTQLGICACPPVQNETRQSSCTRCAILIISIWHSLHENKN